MVLEIVSYSDIGQVRTHNEDTLGSDESLGIVVLADGMGGYQAGEVASAIAVKTILNEVSAQINGQTDERLHNRTYVSALLETAVIKANRAIFDAAESQANYHGMGTTVVAAIFSHEFVTIAHVGDSRLYRLRGNQFVQITVDHSVLQELIDCGYYTREQARHAPNRNLVTRALGVSHEVEVTVQSHDLLAEDIYLLCSDGLNDMLDDTEMQHILDNTQQSMLQRARRLVDAANQHGGEDNISVILARPLRLPAQSPQKSWLQHLRAIWSGQ